MLKINAILFCAVLRLSAGEITEAKKQARIFTFNSEKQDLEVGLDFSIPFLKIPPLNNFDATSMFNIHGLTLPKINVNPSALALSGFLILLTSLIAPLFNKALFGWDPDYRYSRDARIKNHLEWEVSERILKNSRGCPQRIACWLSQKSTNDTLEIWNQLLRNELLSQMVNTTKLLNATARGKKGLNCDAYTPCPLKGQNLPNIISNINILKKKCTNNVGKRNEC